MRHVILYFLFDNPETIKTIQNKSTEYCLSILDSEEVSRIVAVDPKAVETHSSSNWKYKVEFQKNLPSTDKMIAFGSKIVKDFVMKEKLSIIIRILDGYELEWRFMSTTNLDSLSDEDLVSQISKAIKCN